MAGKDVELRIKAKDEASGNVKKISDALKALRDDSENASKGSDKLSGALGSLTGDAAKLQREMDRLKAVGQIASEFDKSAAAVKRLETSLKGTETELAQVTRNHGQAAAASRKLQTQLDGENQAREEQKSALAASRKELRAINALVKEATDAQNALNAARSRKAGGNIASAGVGVESGTAASSARASMGAFLEADLNAQRAAQARVTTEIKNYDGAVKALGNTIKSSRVELSAAEQQQSKLATSIDRTSAAAERERAALNTAKGELNTVGAAVRSASSSMNGMVVTQEAVAQSAERMAAQLARAKAQIATMGEARAPVAPGQDVTGNARENAARREAVERLRELRREMVTAQADAQRLNAAFRSTAQPTEAMGAAAGRAQATVRNLKNELADLTARLRTSGGGFKAFDQAAGGVYLTARNVSAANNSIASSAQIAGAGQRQIAPAVRATGNAMSTAAGQTNQFRGALLGLGSGSRESLSLMQRLRGEVLSLTASYLGFQAAIGQIGGALSAYQKLEATQSRLGAVFAQDTAAVSREIDFLRATADRLGISFGVLSDEYGKLTVAAKSANFDTDATRKIFLSVAEAGRVNKLSTEQMSGVFLALQQMISKTKITSEELSRQMGDRLPGAVTILADALGYTTAELSDLMAKGEVFANQSNLLKWADELGKRFGPQLSASLDTVTTDLGRFENSIFNAQLALAQGFIPGLRDALQSFNEFSSSSQGREFFLELGVGIGNLIKILAEVPKYFALIKAGIIGFVALKAGGAFAGIATSVIGLIRVVAGLNAQYRAVGPQVKQLTGFQLVLTQGFNQTSTAIGNYQAKLLASTAQTRVAAFGTRAFAGTLGVLRVGLATTAGAARALWAAFGGLPGIIATGVALAVGSWLTNVDDATSALVEHERQIELVKNAYIAAGDNLEGWADTIKGVTLTEAETNLTNLTNEYNAKIKQLQDRADGIRIIYERLNSPMGGEIRALNGDAFADGINQIIGLVDQLEAGDKTVKEFRDELDAIAQTNANERIREAAAELLEFTRQADEGKSSLTNLGDAIEVQTKLVNGWKNKTEEMAEVATDGAEAVDGLTNSFDRSAAVKTYTDAIESLTSKIPELAAQMKYLKDMTELNKTAWDGLVAAYQAGDVGAMLQIAGLWAQGAITTQNGYAAGGVTGGLVDRIVGVESGGNATARNPNSSATGAGQFIESTWLAMFNKYFAPQAARMTPDQILAQRNDPVISREMVDLYAQENSRFLAQYGVLINDANLYLAHFLGPNGAKNVLTASPTTPVSQILDQDQISANQSILEGKNAGQVIAWAQQKMGITTQQLAVQERLNELDQEAIDLADKQTQATADRLAEGEFSISQQELINAGKQKQAAVEAAIAAARAENPNITEAEIEALTRLTEQEYELKNVVDGRVAAEEQVNQLYALRQQLLEQLKMAEETGDTTQAANLGLRITEVNGQLDGAIQKAIGMWQAVGGAEADAAIAKLQTMGMSIQQNTQKMGMFGLSMQQWGNLAGSFADGLVGVFDSFAQAIANGEDAVSALGTAFLQFAADFLRQIATMILKQMVLNALQSFFPGLPIGHTGGVVGTRSIGGGNAHMATTPSWAKNAFTYHTGGVAGFKPDEINATLKVGEEVLTEQDPRHRNNLGGEQSAAAGGGQSSRPIKQVLVLDPRDLSNAMASRSGEEVVVTHIKNNISTIRGLLRS